VDWEWFFSSLLGRLKDEIRRARAQTYSFLIDECEDARIGWRSVERGWSTPPQSKRDQKKC